ncbi:MAG TPA: DUF5777 family beta-barrel protein [Vicinamibacterales bacterium]
MPRLFATLLLAATSFVCPVAGFAQDPAAPPPAQAKPDKTPAPPSPGATVELDQTVVNVWTTTPITRHKSYFKLTHRFARDLRRGSFSQLAQDGLGTDNGAIIGLEYRFAVTSNLQAGIHRSILGKTIETFGKWDVRRQSDGGPFGLSVGASIEGQNNLHLDPQPGISATLSHVHGTWLALYANPTYVHNAHTATLRLAHAGHDHSGLTPDPVGEIPGENHHDTAFIGLGMRARIRETVSLVAEGSPRIFGYRPDRAAWNVGIEKLTRGHVLQLNFGNNFDSTAGMVARGGSPHDVYMGFNLSRKF